MKFAVCLWDFDPTQETIDSLCAQGVTAVEPGAHFLTIHDDKTIRAAGERCRAAGIHLYACHPPFGGEADLSQADEGARRRAVTILTQSLARAALAGIACAVIHPSSGTLTSEEHPARRAQLMHSLESLVVIAGQLNVRLALENMLPKHVGSSGGEIRQIVEQFNSPWLGVCFDIGHAHLNPEGAVGAFQVLRERIITFHLQDNDGNTDRHLQPPYGTIDWTAFARCCLPADFPFPWSVEAPPWNGASWTTQLREMEALFTDGLLTISLGSGQAHVVCQQCGRYVFGTLDGRQCGCA